VLDEEAVWTRGSSRRQRGLTLHNVPVTAAYTPVALIYHYQRYLAPPLCQLVLVLLRYRFRTTQVHQLGSNTAEQVLLLASTSEWHFLLLGLPAVAITDKGFSSTLRSRFGRITFCQSLDREFKFESGIGWESFGMRAYFAEIW
jgi:hypothetical protein